MPSVYPNANSPQAWSASATIQLVQAMLGIFPFAPARALALVRPRLPEWLPELTLRNLRVGDATVSLRFRRQEDGSADHEVIERDGVLLVATFPAPDVPAGLDQGWEDRLKEWALEHLPGRMARALRIARGDTEVEFGG